MSRTRHPVEISTTGRLRDQARKLIGEGKDVIDLTAGELAIATPRHIVEAAAAAAHDPTNHHYGSAAGDLELREAVAIWGARRLGAEIQSRQIVVTNGAKQAIFNGLSTVLSPGDDVLIPTPAWVTFPASVRLAGGMPVLVERDADGRPAGAAALERACTRATAAVIIASPHNPTGHAYTATELAELAAWARARGLWVLADDTYADLAFEAAPSLGEVDAGLLERLITVGSTSKSHAMSGWRTGWLIAPPGISDTAAAIQSHTTSNVCRVAQKAALAALTGPDVATSVRDQLRRARDTALALLQEGGLPCITPSGAFYLFPNVAQHGDDVALADRLLTHAGVATVPGTAFAAPGHLRLSFSGDPRRVTDGLERIVLALEEDAT